MLNINKSFFLTVFITGASVLIIEIAAVRILSPTFGSSLYVLSSVLTVILFGLSFGYWYGGKLSDREQSIEKLYSIIAVSGLCTLILFSSSKWLLPILGSYLTPMTGPLIFSLGLFFTPAFLLGIVSPYIIKLQSINTPPEEIGSVIGATFFWGTFGSIFGSLIAGFILIPQLGITKTILLVSYTLIGYGIMLPILTGHPLRTKKITIYIILTILFSSFIYLQSEIEDSKYVYTDDGMYSTVSIIDKEINNKVVRFLVRDTNKSSAIYLESNSIISVFNNFIPLQETLVPNLKNVLVLGGGAYTIPRVMTANYPELKIDVVEIEPDLFSLSQKYFGLNNTENITNHIMDARVFLNQRSTKKYDFIFGDVFGTDLSVPFHLTTKEFYRLVKNHLSPDGIYIMNVTGIPKTNQPSLAGSVFKTLHSVFDTVKSYRLDDDVSEFQNMILIARNSNLPINISAWDLSKTNSPIYELRRETLRLENELILTDDHSPVEYLMSKQRPVSQTI